jgi:hypothetical protein
MNSIADQLPVDIARQIHPDRRKNEAGYWLVRDQLLDQYFGLWIGFADGLVIASGSSPVSVFQAAEASGQHPFLICVGKEEQPCRIRRVSFPYDVAATLGFLIWAQLDGQEHPCRLQADFAGSERILGRDVLNRFEVLFRGPTGDVVVNP